MKKLHGSIVAGTALFWLSVVAFAPPLLVVVGKPEAEPLSQAEKFIRDYQGILTSIGTLALVSCLAVLQVYMSNRSSELREITNRRTQTELKLSEFRRDWIAEVRDDAAELVSIVYNKDRKEMVSRLQFLATRICLKLDPTQDVFEETAGVMLNLISKVRRDEPFSSETTKFQLHIANLLDREWASMKAKLESAQATNG